MLFQQQVHIADRGNHRPVDTRQTRQRPRLDQRLGLAKTAQKVRIRAQHPVPGRDHHVAFRLTRPERARANPHRRRVPRRIAQRRTAHPAPHHRLKAAIPGQKLVPRPHRLDRALAAERRHHRAGGKARHDPVGDGFHPPVAQGAGRCRIFACRVLAGTKGIHTLGMHRHRLCPEHLLHLLRHQPHRQLICISAAFCSPDETRNGLWRE